MAEALIIYRCKICHARTTEPAFRPPTRPDHTPPNQIPPEQDYICLSCITAYVGKIP